MTLALFIVQLVSVDNNKALKAEKTQGFNVIRTRGLHDTSAMPYQLSYEALLGADQ